LNIPYGLPIQERVCKNPKEMILMNSTLVVFDLDGTLIDTAPDLIDSLNHTIALDGLAPVSFGDLTFMVGQGAKVMIGRAFALREAPLSEERHTELLHVFIDHYNQGMPGKSRPYPGLVEALDRLRASGHQLAVCTNKMESLARNLLDGLGLTPYFPVITGGDTFAWRKPDARHLLETVKRAGADPARALMLGDSINDIRAAQNAQIRVIGIPFGYSDVPVETLDPDHIIAHFDELTPELVDRLLGN
jgi:phosphoglycolate phosphatase